MRIQPTGLQGVLVIEPDIHRDSRGFFLEAWNQPRYTEAGIAAEFLQDNRSVSTRGTLRGMHAQTDTGKLVSVSFGEILDVAVDIRRGSSSFGRWVAETLNSESGKQLWIPAGFAHGFCVLSEEARVEYKCTQTWNPTQEISIAWNDPALAIDWPIVNPILSEKDRNAPSLEDAIAGFIAISR